jgi:hypothetical protein
MVVIEETEVLEEKPAPLPLCPQKRHVKWPGNWHDPRSRGYNSAALMDIWSLVLFL